MKFYIFISLFLFLLFPAVIAFAEENFWNKPPHPDGWYGYDESLPDLLNIRGLTYHEARPIIMAAGWSPLQTLEEGSENYNQSTLSGNGPIFWRNGYHELQTCSGTGSAYCAFLFQNKDGIRLRVVTKYEEWGDGVSFAKVAGYRFNP
jgi:hypothetical protein